ncbi:MAG: hypothetical protein ACRENU_06420 [Gemmatimonadaceae bacterium]
MNVRPGLSVASVSDSVRALIERRLPSMDHVEVLLRLREGEATLRVAEIAKLAELDDARTTLVLLDLINAGLVKHDTAGKTFRYETADPGDREVVETLAILYHQFPMVLVKLLPPPAPSAVTDFADAFRLRPGRQ